MHISELTASISSCQITISSGGDPSPNQPHAPVSFLDPPRNLPGLVILASHEDVLPDATSDDPGLLGDISQASVHPHRALQQVHLQQSESSLRNRQRNRGRPCLAQQLQGLGCHSCQDPGDLLCK